MSRREQAVDPPRRALAKLLHANAHRHHLWDVFGDFVEMAALSVRNSVDRFGPGFEAREQRYLQVIGKYDRDEAQRFAQALAALVNAMQEEPGDVLGALFGEMELGNAARGQFFTPYEVCRAMAAIAVDTDTLRAEIARKGFVTLQEPACGAGAMVIAFAQHMQEQGLDYQNRLHVTAIDVDARAVHMTYLQLSLLYVPAKVVHGNTLSLDVHDVWPTPAHVIGFWDNRLRRGYALGSAADVDAEPAPAVAPAPVPVGQLDLFGAAA